MAECFKVEMPRCVSRVYEATLATPMVVTETLVVAAGPALPVACTTRGTMLMAASAAAVSAAPSLPLWPATIGIAMSTDASATDSARVAAIVAIAAGMAAACVVASQGRCHSLRQT